MASIAGALWSSVGKKFLMSLSGFLMLAFLIGHLVGNLQLLDPGAADRYNQYGHLLVGLGGLLIVVELILLAGLVLHTWTAIAIVHGKKKARPVKYHRLTSAGGASRQTLGSRTMIYTGLVVLAFLAMHLKTFKFGPGFAGEPEYTTVVDGVEMRDLHKLVMEKFSDPVYVAGYAIAMVLLGLHLSHAIWSALQSIGVYHPRYTPILYAGGRLLGYAIGAGFFAIPVWIYFTGGAQ